ncbi:hypothetical protein [Lentzea sp. E54]|uniref:hypothetical protein n=1 Tax=Lentzea xerophila TaxID=3435883 RepID=UPI003DA29951
MTGLRIELRRSTALWAGLLVLVAGTGMMWLVSSASGKWRGNSTSALLELRTPLTYVWALVVGLAVFQGMRDSRARVTELFESTSRPGWVRLGTLASAVASVVTIATVLLCAGVVAVVAFGGGFVSIGFVPLVVTTVLALASSVLLGIAVGRMLPHPLTAPVALVTTLMLAQLAYQGSDVQSADDEMSGLALLTPVLNAPYSDLVTTSTSVDLGQIVWFTGLGVTAFLLLVAKTYRGRLVALVPAGLAVAIALSIMPTRISDVLVTDSIAGKLVCDGRVCVSQLHAGDLPKAAAVGREVLAKLAVLPDPPTEIREDTSAMAHLEAPQHNSKIVYFESQDHPRVLTLTPEQIRLELLAGAGVPSCSTPNQFHSREGIVRHLTAGYFNGELAELASESYLWGNERARSEMEAVWQALRSQPAQEQLNRITKARQMLLACEDSEGVLTMLAAR